MNAFFADIQQQPEALRRFAAAYGDADTGLLPEGLRRPERVMLTGMGASYHVAMWGSHLLQARGIWAVAVQTSELISFSARLLHGVDLVIFISQSGASAEVLPFIERLPRSATLVAITNDPESPLARSAQTVLPLLAGGESSVATRTYLNSMACLWLLAQTWHHGRDAQDIALLLRLTDQVHDLLHDAGGTVAALLEMLSPAKRLCFLGHGPHRATAQQAAMMLGEWAKSPSIGTSIGAFRHGLIEIVDSETGVILFGAGGATHESTQSLAEELRSYGAAVILIVEGRLVTPENVTVREFEEMLGVFLDVIPMQLFVEAMARHLGVTLGFRHISKIVQRL